jgi:cytochrome c peroxidase
MLQEPLHRVRRVTRTASPHKLRFARSGLLVASLLLGVSCDPGSSAKPSESRQQQWVPRPLPDVDRTAQEFELPRPAVNSAFGLLRSLRPLPDALEPVLALNTKEQVALGHELFFDRRLSLGQKTACQDCHVLARYGVDGKPVPTGNEGAQGLRNTPTVFNVGGHWLFFWDGRANSLEEQAKGPLLNVVEMALETEAQGLEVLRSMPEYTAAFDRAFPDSKEPALNFENLVGALAAYQRHLVTPGPWDRFLAGDDEAIPKDALRGFVLMVHHGCVACHSGILMAGGIEKLGARHPWPNQKDLGRYQSSGNEFEKMRFRAPSLRNVARTAPYFHDASEATLPGAVRKMAHHQLGVDLSNREVDSIVAFLDTLTGDLPKDLIQEPMLPPSTSRTPPPGRRPTATP